MLYKVLGAYSCYRPDIGYVSVYFSIIFVNKQCLYLAKHSYFISSSKRFSSFFDISHMNLDNIYRDGPKKNESWRS